MNEYYNGNSNESGNGYEFSTPIDPAPIDQTIYQNGNSNPDPKPKKEKKNHSTAKKFGMCAGLAGTFGIIAGCVFLGVSAAGSSVLGLNKSVQIPTTESSKVSSTDSDTATPTSASTSSGDLTVSQVAENCTPAMVAITNKSVQEVQSMFGYGSQSYESESSGSGIIVDQNDDELLIATNSHVVSGAETLSVCFTDNETVEATVKGADSDADLAIVAVKISDIPADTLSAIKVIQMGNSDELSVGDQVVAIGNALGYGQSVSSGYVSAVDRSITIDNVTHDALIQTDAAINPGNSGGALLNMKGELIGINEAKFASSTVEGMGFAIPVSKATPILSDLMNQETRYKVDEDQAGFIGITCKEIASDYAQTYGVPSGVYVDSVTDDGGAKAAGLQKGDIITKFGDTTVTSYKELTAALEYYAAGESVDITFSRADNGEYQEQTATVTLGKKSDSTSASSESGSQDQSSGDQNQQNQQDQSQGNQSQQDQSSLFGMN